MGMSDCAFGEATDGHGDDVERVRCLSCGSTYAKPSGGGTVAANPGCPECGYVGWVPATVPVTRAAQRRSAADLRRRRSMRSG